MTGGGGAPSSCVAPTSRSRLVEEAWRDRTGAVAIALVAAGVVLAVWRGWRTPPTSSLPLAIALFEITSIH